MLLCWLFFFFKQKTAYEMRISDWSSDVCSSDLMVHHPHRDLGDAGRKLLIFDAIELIDGDAAEQRGVDGLIAIKRFQAIEFEAAQFAIGDNEKIAAATRRVEEIGRASCRERVCQYV